MDFGPAKEKLNFEFSRNETADPAPIGRSVAPNWCGASWTQIPLRVKLRRDKFTQILRWGVEYRVQGLDFR